MSEGYPQGRLVRSLTHEGRVRALVVVADGAADETRVRHELAGRSALVAAQGLVASLLMSAHIKGEERLSVQLQAESPRFAFSAEVRAEGGVRARLVPSRLPDGELQGTLVAIKHNGHRELYRGHASVRGSFEQALQHYLVQSQQSHGVVRLGARLDAGGRVVEARGLLVELVGSAMDPADFEQLIAPLRTAPLDELMVEYAFGSLLGAPVQVLESRPVEYVNPVDLARVEGMLRALGAQELREIAAEQGEARVTEHFSNETFVVPRERLLELAAELESGD